MFADPRDVAGVYWSVSSAIQCLGRGVVERWVLLDPKFRWTATIGAAKRISQWIFVVVPSRGRRAADWLARRIVLHGLAGFVGHFSNDISKDHVTRLANRRIHRSNNRKLF